MEIQDLARW